MADTTTYPAVEMAQITCPIEDCEVKVPIHAALRTHYEWDEEEQAAHHRIGVRVDADALEFHMVEHGITPEHDDEGGNGD